MIVSAPPRPPRSTVNVDTIPEPLKSRPQWAAFRYGLRDENWTKIPKQPDGTNAKSNDSSTWSSFQDALDAFEADPTLDGIGYIFAEDDPYCGVDIDKIKNDPERLGWALGIVERLGTYAEWSVSGNGLHAIGEGRMPDADGTPQKGRNDQAKGLEAYSRRRFFTFTGRVVNEASTVVVDVQEHLDWLLANEFKPKDTSRPPARSEHAFGPIATTDRIERIKVRMFGGPRGDQLRRLDSGDAGDYRKADGSPDWSSADLSFCSGAWYYTDGDEATVEALWLGSGLATARPNGSKLDRADYRRDTLTTARGSKTYRDTHGYSAWEDPPRIQFPPKPPERTPIGNDGAATCLTDEPATLEDALALIAQLRQKNAELSQSNIDLLGWVDRTAGFVEELQTCNGTLVRKLTEANEKVERLNRRIYADNRLSRVKALTSSQRDTFRALARLAPSRADHFDNDAPIITSETLGAEIGKHESTARLAAEAVCSLPGSPIKRVQIPGGKYGKVTTYELAARDAADLLEKFVIIAENLEEKVSSRPQPPRCKDHPNAKVLTFTRHVCSRCRKTLASTFPGEDALCVQNPRIDPPADAVDVPVVTTVQNARIVPEPERPSNVIPLTDRRAGLFGDALDMGGTVYVDVGPPEASASLASRTIEHHAHVEVSEEAKQRDLDIIGHCSACQQNTVQRRRSGVWTCVGCSAVILVESWAETPPKPEPPGCTRSGCAEPAANGFVCAGHLRGEVFVPSAEWQDYPPGFVCPPGVRWQPNLATGTSQVRWPDLAGDGGGEA